MDLEPQKINELLDAAKASLLALPADSLLRPRISRERALYMTSILRRELLPVIALIPEELSAARAAERQVDYDELEQRAFVFFAADMAIEDPWPSEKKTRRRELVSRVREHDRHLSSWAIPVFRKNDDARAAVASILRGKGLRDDAEDTLRLVDLFRRTWDEVKGQVPITLEQLAEAESEAEELILLIGTFDSDQRGSLRDIRKRAFTAWLKPYKEVYHLALYLLRGDPGALQRLAVVSFDRVSASAEEDEEDEADERIGVGSD
jgi:hypothetical protein